MKDFKEVYNDLQDNMCKPCVGRGTLDFFELTGDDNVPCQACDGTGWAGGQSSDFDPHDVNKLLTFVVNKLDREDRRWGESRATTFVPYEHTWGLVTQVEHFIDETIKRARICVFRDEYRDINYAFVGTSKEKNDATGDYNIYLKCMRTGKVFAYDGSDPYISKLKMHNL